jgi:hypothetical protein
MHKNCNKIAEANKDNEDFVVSHTLPKDIEKHINKIATLDLDTIITKHIRLYGKVRIVSIDLTYFFIETIEYVNDFFHYDFYSDENKAENSVIPNNGAMVSFLLARSGSLIYAYSVNIIPKREFE